MEIIKTCAINQLNFIKMRERLKHKVDIVEFVRKSDEEYARREAIIEDALLSIVKEKNVRYKEAKRLLSSKLKFSIMLRLMAEVV